MAITTVNPRYEGFIFDGENSRDYGIYVQDVKVFGAPTRDVEMISIPGRDGEFALDKGRFNNIQVVYTCALGTDTQTDFNTGVSDFRNWLASRRGYKRLEDEINTAEYRVAVFKDGLDVSTLNKETGTFEVTFDCKPQRFLKSGETAVTVTSGGTLTNPTLFESRPLLQVWGYGDIDINGDVVSIDDAIIGNVDISGRASGGAYTLADFSANNGDTITINKGTATTIYFNGITPESVYMPVTIGTTSGNINTSDIFSYNQSGGVSAIAGIVAVFGTNTFSYGTTETKTLTVPFTISVSDSTDTATATTTFRMAYDGRKTIVFSASVTPTTITIGSHTTNRMTPTIDLSNTTASVYSTKSALGEPLYFDLDIGEAYKEEGGEIVSVNNAVSFPAELPTLKAGNNTITFDNTVDSLKIVPRWWKV